MTDPHASRELGVTIKTPESAKFAADNPWFTFRAGSPDALIADIAEFFGIDSTDLTGYEVAMNAQRIASNVGGAAQSLGGTMLPANSQGPKTSVFQQAAGTPAPAAAEPAPDVDPILAGIEAAADIDVLQKIWQRNQALFTPDSEYMKAYKAKGKSLTA